MLLNSSIFLPSLLCSWSAYCGDRGETLKLDDTIMNSTPNETGLKGRDPKANAVQAKKKIKAKKGRGRPPGKYKKKKFTDDDLEEYISKMAKKHTNNTKVAAVLLKYADYKKKYVEETSTWDEEVE